MSALTQTSKKGFTLIELMVTVSIIAIIASVGMVSFSQSQKLGRDAKRKQDLRSISIALEIFYQKNNRYPCSSGWVFSTGSADWLRDFSGTSPCPTTTTSITPTYLNKLPIDPLNTAANPYNSTTAPTPSETGTNYSYAYYSGNTCNGITGTANTFILVTQLENKSDADRLAAQNVRWCGTGQNLYNESDNTITSGTAFAIVGG